MNLKKTDIENRTFYYFDDIMTAEDIDSSDILLDKKNKKQEKNKNTLIYDISYKMFMGSKPLRINHYLVIGAMIKFFIILNILLVKK